VFAALMAGVLYGVRPLPVATYGAAATLLTVAAVACTIPARAANRAPFLP